MKTTPLVLAIIVILICSAFTIAVDGGDPHRNDRDKCTSCHTELSEPFESTPLPEVALYKGRIAVVLEHRGDVCRLSGIGWVGMAPCSELQYPQNYFYKEQTG